MRDFFLTHRKVYPFLVVVKVTFGFWYISLFNDNAVPQCTKLNDWYSQAVFVCYIHAQKMPFFLLAWILFVWFFFSLFGMNLRNHHDQ